MRTDGYASVSIRRKFATARVFFTYWVRRGALDKSPLWRIRLDLGREQLLPRSLSPGDAKLLIEEIWRNRSSNNPSGMKPSDSGFLHLRNVAAIEMLFATGIRVGELFSLEIENWCKADRAFVVKGKGSRQRLAFLPDDRSLKAVQMYLSARNTLALSHTGLLVNATGARFHPRHSTNAHPDGQVCGDRKQGDATRNSPHGRHLASTIRGRHQSRPGSARPTLRSCSNPTYTQCRRSTSHISTQGTPSEPSPKD